MLVMSYFIQCFDRIPSVKEDEKICYVIEIAFTETKFIAGLNFDIWTFLRWDSAIDPQTTFWNQ